MLGENFARWGEVFGDHTVAAMIDRIVHHAEVIALKVDSYRLKNRRVPAASPERTNHQGASTFTCRGRVDFQPPLTPLTVSQEQPSCQAQGAALPTQRLTTR